MSPMRIRTLWKQSQARLRVHLQPSLHRAAGAADMAGPLISLALGILSRGETTNCFEDACQTDSLRCTHVACVLTASSKVPPRPVFQAVASGTSHRFDAAAGMQQLCRGDGVRALRRDDQLATMPPRLPRLCSPYPTCDELAPCPSRASSKLGEVAAALPP